MNSNSDKRTFWGVIRMAFGRGIVILVPVVITIWVLHILFNAIDGIISPILDQIIGRHIPGIGFISMVIIILIVGILSRNLIGRTIFKFFERILASIPIARIIYSAMKDLIRAFQIGGKGKSFRQVVLIEYPRQGLFTIGFVTHEITVHGKENVDEMLSVYIPNPPNPTSGIMILVPRLKVQVLNMSIEDGLKLALSGGIVTSGSIHIK